jgi:hypothetical protein
VSPGPPPRPGAGAIRDPLRPAGSHPADPPTAPAADAVPRSASRHRPSPPPAAAARWSPLLPTDPATAPGCPLRRCSPRRPRRRCSTGTRLDPPPTAPRAQRADPPGRRRPQRGTAGRRRGPSDGTTGPRRYPSPGSLTGTDLARRRGGRVPGPSRPGSRPQETTRSQEPVRRRTRLPRRTPPFPPPTAGAPPARGARRRRRCGTAQFAAVTSGTRGGRGGSRRETKGRPRVPGPPTGQVDDSPDVRARGCE